MSEVKAPASSYRQPAQTPDAWTGPAMKARPVPPQTIDQYIAAFPPEVQGILQRVRQVVREAAPEAQEVVSYGMPAFKQGGILVHFGAFKNHLGLYPPVRGDPDIEKAIAPYAGEKGNLRIPFGKPIPYDLIARIAALRLRQNLAKAVTRRHR